MGAEEFARSFLLTDFENSRTREAAPPGPSNPLHGLCSVEMSQRLVTGCHANLQATDDTGFEIPFFQPQGTTSTRDKPPCAVRTSHDDKTHKGMVATRGADCKAFREEA